MCRLAPIMLLSIVASQNLDAATQLPPKLASKEKVIRSVALLPPTAQMKAVVVVRRDIKEKEGEHLASVIGTLVSAALKKRGWEVNDTAFSRQATQDKEDVKYLVDDLCARHQILTGQIWMQDAAKRRSSLGDRVAKLGARVPVDALVLVHADGERFTEARQDVLAAGVGALEGARDGIRGTRAATMAGASMDRPTDFELDEYIRSGAEKYVSLRISLVDPQTGDVLSYSTVPRAAEEQILKELRRIP